MVQVVESIEKKGRKRMVTESTKMTLLDPQEERKGKEKAMTFSMKMAVDFAYWL